jgi:hypothetical protein
MDRAQLQRRIEQIKRQLGSLGPMHPGSLSEQYNVCGQPACRCKDPQQPQRHGPYYQLSYVCGGKHTTRFVTASRVAAMREKVANYRQFRELINEWVELAVEMERVERAEAKHSDGD